MLLALIAEDEASIADILRKYFIKDGFNVVVTADGRQVESLVAQFRPDLLLLDLQLPGRDGMDICSDLRASGNTMPILMITARVDEIHRLSGLDGGADDYICKPFSPKEVLARARAVLRRSRISADPRGCHSDIRIGELTIDTEQRQLWRGQRSTSLTPIEMAVLMALLETPGQVRTRRYLLERSCGRNYVGYQRNIDSHIKNLRHKLSELFPDCSIIRSVYRSGYVFDPNQCGTSV